MGRIRNASGIGIGYFILNIAVAIYLFANGIMGFTTNTFGQRGGEFVNMVNAIGIKGDLAGMLVIVLSVCAIAAGVFLLLQIFKVEVKITDLILFIFVILWAVFIVIVNIIHPLQNTNSFKILPYLSQLSAHLMVFGALVTSTKRLG
jgi:hypothetical protein